MSGVEQHRDTGQSPGQPDFEQIFLPHLDAAYNLARWLLRNDQDAEDAVQEAYMRAYKAFARFRGGDGKAWFMTILRNVCYTMIKKLRSHETPEPFDEEIHQTVGETEMQEAFRQRANVETLHAALEKLPDEFREIIVLHDLEGLAYKEIAAIAGIPIGTVMSRLARARGRLRVEILTSTAREASP
jgi:RNA polymerase sigma-70 factor (ECF subfamily)